MQTAGAIGGLAASLVRVPTEVELAYLGFIMLENCFTLSQFLVILCRLLSKGCRLANLLLLLMQYV